MVMYACVFLCTCSPPGADDNYIRETREMSALAGYVSAAMQQIPNQPLIYTVSSTKIFIFSFIAFMFEDMKA